MERHFTATAYIFNDAQVLLHHHAKLNAWLPPGGHLEPNETPHEAAKREALEETGLEIEFLEQDTLHIDSPNATSFPKPYLCLLENIPPHKEKSAHQHMDMIYLAKPKVFKDPLPPFRWFSIDEALLLPLLPDVRAVLLHTRSLHSSHDFPILSL